MLWNAVGNKIQAECNGCVRCASNIDTVLEVSVGFRSVLKVSEGF